MSEFRQTIVPYGAPCTKVSIDAARLPFGLRSGVSHNPIADVSLFLVGVSVTLYVVVVTAAGIDLRPMRVVPLIIGFVVFSLMRTPAIRHRSVYVVVPCIWATYMLLRHSLTGHDGLIIGLRSATNVFIYLTTLKLLRRSDSGRGLPVGLVVGCMLSIGVALLDIELFGMAPFMRGGRAQGLMPGPNQLANLCSLVMLIGVTYAFDPQAWQWKLVASLVAFLASAGMLMSGSRGAMIATCVALGVFVASRVSRKRLFVTVVMAAVMAPTIFVSGTLFLEHFESHIPERITSLVHLSNDSISEIQNDDRTSIFAAAFAVFADNPVVGASSDAERLDVNTSKGYRAIGCHSLYLYLLSTSGIIGFILYLSLPIALLFRLGRLSQHDMSRAGAQTGKVAGAMSLLVIICVHGLVIDIAQTVHVWVVYAMAAHLCIRPTLAPWSPAASTRATRGCNRARRPDHLPSK